MLDDPSNEEIFFLLSNNRPKANISFKNQLESAPIQGSGCVGWELVWLPGLAPSYTKSHYFLQAETNGKGFSEGNGVRKKLGVFFLFTDTKWSKSEPERTGKCGNKGNQTGKPRRKEEGIEKVQGRGKWCMGVEVANTQEGYGSNS